jgi:hypothetical protein
MEESFLQERQGARRSAAGSGTITVSFCALAEEKGDSESHHAE